MKMRKKIRDIGQSDDAEAGHSKKSLRTSINPRKVTRYERKTP